MPATVNANNVALGVGSIYTAPKDTVRPTDAMIISDAIVSPWVFVGATQKGVTMTYDQTLIEIMIEEQSTAVTRLKSVTKFNFAADLSEDTMATLALGYSGNLAVIAAGIAGSGIAAGTELRLQDSITEVAIACSLINPSGFRRIVYVPRVVQAGNVATALRRVTEQRLYPMLFEATPTNTSDIYWKDFPSAAAPP